MRIKTSARTTHIADVPDIGELSLTFAPLEWCDTHVERIGDTVVIGYLISEDYAENPLERGDCEGDIYLSKARDSVFLDTTQVRLELGCQDGRFSGEEPAIDDELLTLNKTLRDLAIAKKYEEFAADEDSMFAALTELEYELEDGETLEAWWPNPQYRVEIENWIGELDETYDLAVELYSTHWQLLAGPFVVPISYDDHGSNGASVDVDTWDGDPDELPGGVWVANSGAMHNLMYGYIGSRESDKPIKEAFQVWKVSSIRDKKGVVKHYGRWATRYWLGDDRENAWPLDAAIHMLVTKLPLEELQKINAEAIEYAEGVCKEVTAWMSGDCYCVVIETHKLNGDEWEQVDYDICGGFYGSEYAEEALKSDYFEPTVKALKAKEGAPCEQLPLL